MENRLFLRPNWCSPYSPDGSHREKTYGVPVRFGNEVRSLIDQISKADKKVDEEGYGVGFGMGFGEWHEVPCKTVVGCRGISHDLRDFRGLSPVI